MLVHVADHAADGLRLDVDVLGCRHVTPLVGALTGRQRAGEFAVAGGAGAGMWRLDG